MRVKAYKGKIFGADFTANERKAMNIEINKQIVKRDAEYQADLDALVLYVLASKYGWRKKRLRQFWDNFVNEHKALREHYCMENSGDSEWLAHHELKKIGVDVHQWYKEEQT